MIMGTVMTGTMIATIIMMGNVIVTITMMGIIITIITSHRARLRSFFDAGGAPDWVLSPESITIGWIWIPEA